MAMTPSGFRIPQEKKVDTVDTIVETESAPLDPMVEDITPVETSVMPEPQQDFGGSEDLADSTMVHIYDNYTEGTKEEQIMATANQYFDELFSLGASMPELSNMQDAQAILNNMYAVEAQKPLVHNPKGELSRELVDTLNGRLEGKKKAVAEVRKSMIQIQSQGLYIPVGAGKEEIKDIQYKAGLRGKDLDGIVGPRTRTAVESFNVDMRLEAKEARGDVSQSGEEIRAVNNNMPPPASFIAAAWEDTEENGAPDQSAPKNPRVFPEDERGSLVDEKRDPSKPKRSQWLTEVGKAAEEGVTGISDRFMKHLAVREGVRDVSYKDSEGFLTGGTGHLMTDEEKKLYPEGTKIPKDVTDAWLKEDTQEAMGSAKDQARELGVSDKVFIEALASVNFQLGSNWNKEHKETWKLIKRGEYKKAAKEAANSVWGKQTPVRVEDFQKALIQLSK